jgi:hypothetical protein
MCVLYLRRGWGSRRKERKSVPAGVHVLVLILVVRIEEGIFGSPVRIVVEVVVLVAVHFARSVGVVKVLLKPLVEFDVVFHVCIIPDSDGLVKGFHEFFGEFFGLMLGRSDEEFGSLNLDDAQERVKESTHLIFVELVNVVRDEPGEIAVVFHACIIPEEGAFVQRNQREIGSSQPSCFQRVTMA